MAVDLRDPQAETVHGITLDRRHLEPDRPDRLAFQQLQVDWK
jgi:hypothetical protein